VISTEGMVSIHKPARLKWCRGIDGENLIVFFLKAIASRLNCFLSHDMDEVINCFGQMKSFEK